MRTKEMTMGKVDQPNDDAGMYYVTGVTSRNVKSLMTAALRRWRHRIR